MLRKVQFLAIVPKRRKKKTIYIAYFFCKKTKQVLDIRVSPKTVDFTIQNSIRKGKTDKAVLRILKKFRIRKIIIRGSENHKPVCAVRIREGYIKKDFLFSFYIGFAVAQTLNIPIEVDNKLLKERGIYIDKQIIEASLNQRR